MVTITIKWVKQFPISNQRAVNVSDVTRRPSSLRVARIGGAPGEGAGTGPEPFLKP